MIEDYRLAQLTIEFMQRVDLKGNEVPAYNAVMSWLVKQSKAPQMDIEPSKDTDLKVAK